MVHLASSLAGNGDVGARDPGARDTSARISALFLLSKRQPPSSRLRMTACFEDFRALGIEPTAIPIPSDPVGRLRMLAAARSHDVVVLQKKTSLHAHELKLLRWANPRLVFDMDDAVMFHELEHHRPLSGKNFLKFIRTIDHCMAVVAGNAFLARFAEPNCATVSVLPTPVDLRRYAPKCYADAAEGTVTIGWLGVAGNLHYLRRLSEVFASLAEEFPSLRIKIISNQGLDIPGITTVFEPWTLAGEIDGLRSFDIGVMPLDDTLWARGKCGYKILQYMGVAVPAVASPVGINADFIQHGETGFLAQTPEEWRKALARLVGDYDLRRRMGEAGRQRLEAHYSQQRYVQRYAALLHGL